MEELAAAPIPGTNTTNKNVAINGSVSDRTFFPMAMRPNAGQGLLILEVSRSHTTTHHSR
jgi:hypothetical protein